MENHAVFYTFPILKWLKNYTFPILNRLFFCTFPTLKNAGELDSYQLERYNSCSQDQYYVKFSDIFIQHGKNPKTGNPLVMNNPKTFDFGTEPGTYIFTEDFKKEVLSNYDKKADNFVQ